MIGGEEKKRETRGAKEKREIIKYMLGSVIVVCDNKIHVM